MNEHRGLGLMVLAVLWLGAQVVLSAATHCNVTDPGHVTAETKYRSTDALPGAIGGAFAIVAAFGYARSGKEKE